MDAMVLVRGSGISVHELAREALEGRGLVSPRDPRRVLTFELDDGALAADLLGSFEGLRARPRWSVVSHIRHVLGSAFEQHEDPRGFFVLPHGDVKPETYDGAIGAASTVGFWVPKTPAFPNGEAARFERLKDAYGSLDAGARRRMLGLQPKK